MSIPPDFRDYEHDPVLSDERLTPDEENLKFVPDLPVPLGDPRKPPPVGSPTTKMQKSGERAFDEQKTDMQGQGSGRQTQAQMGIGIETALTREEVMGPRPSGLPSAASPAEGNPLLRTGMHPGGGGYSDLVRQGAPLSTKPPQTKAVYGARTQAALLANIEKTRFRGNAPVRISPYLERPTSKSNPTSPDKSGLGRPPDDRAVEPTTKEERMGMAEESPRDAHRDITEHELWRDLMEESPAHTAGTRSSFDSLLSPRGGRAVNRAMRGGDPQIVMTEDLSVHTPPTTDWPGSIDPKTMDSPPPEGPRHGANVTSRRKPSRTDVLRDRQAEHARWANRKQL